MSIHDPSPYDPFLTAEDVASLTRDLLHLRIRNTEKSIKRTTKESRFRCILHQGSVMSHRWSELGPDEWVKWVRKLKKFMPTVTAFHYLLLWEAYREPPKVGSWPDGISQGLKGMLRTLASGAPEYSAWADWARGPDGRPWEESPQCQAWLARLRAEPAPPTRLQVMDLLASLKAV